VPATELHEQKTESERVARWRAEELERAGFGPADAAAIAARSDIDLHVAIELLLKGCSPELAKQILL